MVHQPIECFYQSFFLQHSIRYNQLIAFTKSFPLPNVPTAKLNLNVVVYCEKGFADEPDFYWEISRENR